MVRKLVVALALMAGLSMVAVPQMAWAKDASVVAVATAPIDLNTATLDELQMLPGVGPVKAQAIVDGRPYRSLKDFESRNILSASVLDKVKGQVTVSKAAKPAAAAAIDETNPPEPMGKINLNTASAEELEVLPGIGPARAKAIVEGRPYRSIADFEAKGIVAKSVVEKFKDVIEVGAAGAAQSDGEATPAVKRIRMCGAKWREAKAVNKVPAGMTWPEYWSRCNTELKKRGY